MHWILLIFGLFIMLVGSDQLVKGCTRLSQKYHVSPFVVSVIIIGLGTSLPNLLVSLIASARGLGTVVLSNNIASINIDTLGVLGIAAIIRPIVFASKKRRADLLFLGFSILVASLMIWSGRVGQIDGLILFLILGAYLFYVSEHNHYKAKSEYMGGRISFPIGIGILSLYAGSTAFMNSVETISALYGLNQDLAGILLVGPATSAPELMVSVIAALKKQHAVVIGNIVGSNFMNIVLAIATGALLADLPVTLHLQYFDTVVMILATGLLFFSLLANKKISRGMGFVYLMLFAAYIALAVVF